MFHIIGDLFDKTCYLTIVQLINHSLYHLHQSVLLLTQLTHHIIKSMKPAHFIPQQERGPECRSDPIILLLCERKLLVSVHHKFQRLMLRTGLGALSCTYSRILTFALASASSILLSVDDRGSCPHTQPIPAELVV